MSNKVFVMAGQTDSGDDFGPYVWTTKPTDEQIKAVFVRDIPEEVEAECCDCWELNEAILEDN